MPRQIPAFDARSKPVAGYPSQTAACRALADLGCSPEEIGREIGRDPYHVRATLRRISHGQRPRTFVLPARFGRQFTAEAHARGIDTIELATRLLDAITRDDLFDALLGERPDA